MKAALGKADHVVRLSAGATVQDAINTLAEIYPEEFSRFVLVGGKLTPSVLLSINEKQVDTSAALRDGDTLTLLSAISGG